MTAYNLCCAKSCAKRQSHRKRQVAALQDVLDELRASRASRQRARENLQEIRWVLKDVAGIELPQPKNVQDAIIDGEIHAKRLKSTGRVGTGFSEKLPRDLYLKLNKIRVEECPFLDLAGVGRGGSDQGLTAAEMKRCHWVKPVIVRQVKFTEWKLKLRPKLNKTTQYHYE